MITATMDSFEIRNAIAKLIPRIEKYAYYQFKKMASYSHRNGNRPCWRGVLWNADGNTYCLSLQFKSWKDTSTYITVFIPELNGWFDFHNDPTSLSFRTAHFYRRYAERVLGDKNLPVEKVITEMHKRCIALCRIYKNEDTKNFVYACNDGIILGYVDMKKFIKVYTTFISNDMLKDIQSDAYDCVRNIISEYDKHIDAEGTEEAFLPDVEQIKMLVEANEIYSRFPKNKHNKHNNN